MGIPAVGAAHEEAIRFTQNDFDAFARLSGDDNPIHVDPDFAAGTQFGATVAHGMMLFGAMSAAVTRWLNEPVTIHVQDLMFPAPTFAGADHHIHLEVRQRQPGLVVGQRIVTGDGTETAIGEMLAAEDEVPVDPTPPTATGPDEYKGFRLGMTAAALRSFLPAEVEEFGVLVDERHPSTEVPPALLGGTVSHLLGVELPGPGANWLKQRYQFLRPVLVGEAVRTEVAMVRFRPEKHLVDLSVHAVVGYSPVICGRTLVHTQDVEPR